MALKNKIIPLFVSALLIGVANAKIELPELLAKQALSNIRFISNSGKFTYYQKNSGSLLFSSNYKVIEILKSEVGTQYEVIGTPARKKLVVTQNSNFHNFYSLRNNRKIYIADYGGQEVREVGLGTNPILHVDDSWLSYYNYYSRTINFEHTTNSALKFSIKLNNRINPYFSPKVIMPDENTVYYTDLSETGAPGLLQYKRNISKSDILYKAKTPMIKLEICYNNNNLIMGEFGINFSNNGSSIAKINYPFDDFNKRDNIYNSKINDIGQILCNIDDNNLVFIKNSGTAEAPTTDVFEIDLKSKAIKPLSELKSVTSIINMDGSLITIDKGRTLIVKGNADFKNIDSFKALPPSGATEAIKDMDKVE
jgi:hypothetical protein